MLFTTYKFLIFFLTVYVLFKRIKNNTGRKILLLIASYIFYMAWNPCYSLLMLSMTLVSFLCGKSLIKKQKNKRILVAIGTGYGLIILGVFKYWNFFVENLNPIIKNLIHLKIPFLSVLLPIGISFYTFQTISFLIDSYRGKFSKAPNLLDYSLYISFFPQLVAGPIVRADNFLPQLQTSQEITKIMKWQALILLFSGFFKKIVLADNLIPFVDNIFNTPAAHSGLELITGAYAFAIQIYADFSGYSDIAIGCALLLGYSIPINFNYPYLAKNPSDFWNRWHISLSSWLKDYLYIPLGGNRKGKFKTLRNLFIVMFLGGLWHGASWNFVIWGIYCAILLIAYKLLDPLFKYLKFIHKKIRNFFATIIMLQLTIIGWVIFRSQNTQIITDYFKGIMKRTNWESFPSLIAQENHMVITIIILFFLYHLLNLKINLKEKISKKPFNPWLISALIIGLFIILLANTSQKTPFIYFQF